jgi:hypothetical protein
MIIADEILDLLQRKRRLKLTATAIAEILYWEDKSYQQRVKASCLTLYEEGRLSRASCRRRGLSAVLILSFLHGLGRERTHAPQH